VKEVFPPLIAAVALFGHPMALAAASSEEASMLTFVFPDGARGGTGKIQGTAKRSTEIPEDFALMQIRRCGLRDARRSEIQVSHRYSVVGRRTSGDRDIVRCVKRSVPLHFTVYDDTGDAKFREFWSSRSAENKAN
jgi:hypothetical protein